MKINDLCKEAHELAKEKGWYPSEGRNLGELIALITSELSEALEEARIASFKQTESNNYTYYESDKENSSMDKPEGFAIEIADTVIRIADLCGYYNIDLEKALKIKMDYNKTRPVRHGGKVF